MSKNHGQKQRQALLADLQRLGFSEYEARIYLSLLKSPSVTAYEVSKETGLPRSNTYAALESLTKKMAVQPVSQNPVRYVPVEPSALLGQWSREVNAVCGRLEAGLRHLEGESGLDVVWTIVGQADITAKIGEMIDDAKEHVWIKAAEDVLNRHSEQLRKAAKRGVKILIILFGSDVAPFVYGPTCSVYLHEGNGIRMGGADNLFTITSDYKTALTARLADDMLGAYTISEPVVRMAESLIRHDYYLAEIFKYFGKEIDEKFGPILYSLREQTFSTEQFAILRDRMHALGVDTFVPRTKQIAATVPAQRRRSARKALK